MRATPAGSWSSRRSSRSPSSSRFPRTTCRPCSPSCARVPRSPSRHTTAPATGTTRLKAVFDNRDEGLFPNQFVNVRLLLDVRKDAVIVPAAAIQRGPQGTFAYVVKADRTVEVRALTPGPTTAGETAIDAGLDAGETVVVDGVDKLRAGALVDVRTRADGRPSA